MNEQNINKFDRKIKWALLIVSLLTVVVLFISALREDVLVQWRLIRMQYAQILDEKATDEQGRKAAEQFELGIDHVVIPALGKTDRCITCHVGLEDPRMSDQVNPYRTHPGDHLLNHPVGEFGCTICHEGQGLATTMADAHGHIAHWDWPMLAPEHLYSSCAKCHDGNSLFAREGIFAKLGDPQPNGARLMARGKELLDTKGCLGCHVVEGVGGSLGPDITFVGEKTRHEFDFSHFSKDEPREVPYWLKKHFLEPQEIIPGTVMPDMNLSEDDADALTTYVMSLKKRNSSTAHEPKVAVAIPESTEAHESGEALYMQMCAACHGPDGRQSDVPGIRSVALNNVDSLAVVSDDYMRAIIDKGRTGTAMPAWGPDAGALTYPQIDSIIAHIRNWEHEGADITAVSAERGDATMGKAYYSGLCANCHGRNGVGGIGNTLNSPTFLAIASDDFLARTIIEGRPNTAMASWKHLPAQAVSDLLAYMRTWHGDPPVYEEVALRLALGTDANDKDYGRSVFAGHCTMCHGDNGEGGIGPRLNSIDIVPAMSDEYLYRAIVDGRPSTAMPAWRHLGSDQIAALIVYMRSWSNNARLELAKAPRRGDYNLGEYHYRVSCAACHGERGEGGVGPQLANPALLSAASDDLLYQWIAHGRADTAMQGFIDAEQGVTELTPEQIGDVIAYLRHSGSRDDVPTLRTGIGNPHVGRDLFVGNCAGCHGVDGEGASGPQLHNSSFMRAASDGFLSATIALGRIGTPMQSMVHGQEGLGQIDPEQVQDIIAYMRYWDVSDTWRAQRPVAEMSKRAVDAGRAYFSQYCSGCHGSDGKGQQDGPEFFAPSLNNPEFLAAASDGFLLATIARGRSNTPMRPFGIGAGGIAALDAATINDIVSYIRSWQTGQGPQGE